MNTAIGSEHLLTDLSSCDFPSQFVEIGQSSENHICVPCEISQIMTASSSACSTHQAKAKLTSKSLLSMLNPSLDIRHHGALLPNSEVTVHRLLPACARGSYNFIGMKCQQCGKGNLFSFPHSLLYVKSQACENVDPFFQTNMWKCKKSMCDNLSQNTKRPRIRESNTVSPRKYSSVLFTIQL